MSTANAIFAITFLMGLVIIPAIFIVLVRERKSEVFPKQVTVYMAILMSVLFFNSVAGVSMLTDNVEVTIKRVDDNMKTFEENVLVLDERVKGLATGVNALFESVESESKESPDSLPEKK